MIDRMPTDVGREGRKCKLEPLIRMSLCVRWAGETTGACCKWR